MNLRNFKLNLRCPNCPPMAVRSGYAVSRHTIMFWCKRAPVMG